MILQKCPQESYPTYAVQKQIRNLTSQFLIVSSYQCQLLGNNWVLLINVSKLIITKLPYLRTEQAYVFFLVFSSSMQDNLYKDSRQYLL